MCGGGAAEAVAPLTSGEDVANIVEADLFQRLGEAGKGEAAPDSRPGESGEAELDLGGRGLRNKRFVQGGRGDSLQSVGPHKIEVSLARLSLSHHTSHIAAQLHAMPQHIIPPRTTSQCTTSHRITPQ